MKKIILLFVALGVLSIGGYYFFRTDETKPESDIESDEEVNAEDENAEESNGTSTEPSDSETESSPKEFSIIARQFAFEPNSIKASVGDKVILKIKSMDVTHGIAIPEFNVNEVLNPGEEKTVEFTADKAGTYTIFCSVVCGSGHTDMKGTLIVE